MPPAPEAPPLPGGQGQPVHPLERQDPDGRGLCVGHGCPGCAHSLWPRVTLANRISRDSPNTHTPIGPSRLWPRLARAGSRTERKAAKTLRQALFARGLRCRDLWEHLTQPRAMRERLPRGTGESKSPLGGSPRSTDLAQEL